LMSAANSSASKLTRSKSEPIVSKQVDKDKREVMLNLDPAFPSAV
jgi:hypothetical protein